MRSGHRLSCTANPSRRNSGFQAGLEERGLAAGGHRDLLRVDVDRQHLVAEIGQADRMGEAEVSGPDHGDPRQLALLLVDVPRRFLPTSDSRRRRHGGGHVAVE
jgi:hypothetical protein